MSRRDRLIQIASGEPLMMRPEAVGTLSPLLRRALTTPGADDNGSPTRKALRRWSLSQRAGGRGIPRGPSAMEDDDVVVDTPPKDPNAYGVMPRIAVFATAEGPKRMLMLPVVGPLDRCARDVQDSHGVEMSTSYERVMEYCDVVEKELDGLVMIFDTPGGSCAGLFEARARIAELAEVKPVLAFVPAAAFSAGLVLATAANRRCITPGAFIGSVGAMQVHMEISRMLAEEGVGVSVLASNENKAAVNPYQPLSENGRRILQSEIDELGKMFDNVLLALPGMNAQRLEQIKKDQFYCGEKGVLAGLADAVCATEEEAVADFFSSPVREVVTENRVQSGEEVSEEEDNPDRADSPGVDLEPTTMSTANTNAAASTSAASAKLTAQQIAQMAGGADVIAEIERQAEAKALAKLQAQNNQPASIEQLEAIFGENNPQVLACFKAKTTEAQARQQKADADAARLAELERSAQANQAAAAARAKLAQHAATQPVNVGAAGLATGGTGEHPYLAAIKAHPLYKNDRIAATRAVYCERQDLYKDYAKKNSAAVDADAEKAAE